MAFEQLWSVDQLDEYAVIQGMVTPEESDVIITRELARGFVMVARYHSHMVLPAGGSDKILEYPKAQSTDVPSALHDCLDLNRFTGDNQ